MSGFHLPEHLDLGLISVLRPLQTLPLYIAVGHREMRRDLFRHSLPLPSSNVLRGLRLLCTAAIQRMHAPTGDSKAFSPPSGCRTNPLVSRQVSRSYDQHREARQKKATNTTMYAGAREPPGATFSCSSGLGFAMRRGQVSAPARADAMATHLPQQQAAGLFD
jgi:hypothetical protein